MTFFEAFQKDLPDRRHGFAQGKQAEKKSDVCILSVCFSTLENNDDGDFELTFNFHSENPTTNERLTAPGGQ